MYICVQLFVGNVQNIQLVMPAIGWQCKHINPCASYSLLTTVIKVMVKQPATCLGGCFSCLSHTTEPLIHNTLSIMSAIESTNIGWTWGMIMRVLVRPCNVQPVYPGIADGFSVESRSYNWECAQNAAKWDIIVRCKPYRTFTFAL